MENELLLKLERASRDRDFFLLNKSRIYDSYQYLDSLLTSYIDICCHIFKTFKVNKTSYIYGSIATLAAGIVLSKQKFFANSLGGDPIENLTRDVFPLFVETYNTTTLVEEKTQLHMVKGYIEEFNKNVKYIPGLVDSYLTNNVSDIVKRYLNQIIFYCLDHKLEQFCEKDVVDELLPYLRRIPF